MPYQTPPTGKSIGDYNSFGVLLRDYRIACGLRQDFVAEQIGVSASYLSKIETGVVKEPSGTFIINASNYFGWKTDELNELFEASKSKQLTARISELEAQVHDEDKFPSGSVLDEKSKAVLMSDVLAKGKYVRLLEHVVASYGREHSN
ncbi:MAG: helix-turn-helix domain-containing protein [Nanoarchaeota archaeon]|nr:helix-turn-helix domain-containing protein [Nanoarchaeota archaeon]